MDAPAQLELLLPHPTKVAEVPRFRMSYIKLTRPDGKPVWLDTAQRPRRITYPVDSNGNCELFWAAGDFERVKEYPDDVRKLFDGD